MRAYEAMHPPDDAALLSLARAGDRQALEALSRRWWPRIRRQCLAILGDAALAEDAAQESLVRLVRGLDRYDPDRPFAPWLSTLVRNTCRDLRRRGPREVLDNTRAPEPQPDRTAHRMDLRRAGRRAREAWAGLAPRQREALDLVDWQGLSPAEAAEQMGVAPGTAPSSTRAAAPCAPACCPAAARCSTS
jgi:RNA polymerase sigma factor (sigma-70 family)